MGNATSHRNITVTNENLTPVIEAQQAGDSLKAATKSVEKSKEPRERVILNNRDVPPSKEVMMSQEEQLRAAMEPYKRLSRQSTSAAAIPTEQKVLIECFKKNPGSSLVCVKEIQNFVNYVNKTTTMNSQP